MSSTRPSDSKLRVSLVDWSLTEGDGSERIVGNIAKGITWVVARV
jgi:hypothetical protein